MIHNINALEIINTINKEKGYNFTLVNSDFKVIDEMVLVENNGIIVKIRLIEGKIEVV